MTATFHPVHQTGGGIYNNLLILGNSFSPHISILVECHCKHLDSIVTPKRLPTSYIRNGPHIFTCLHIVFWNRRHISLFNSKNRKVFCPPIATIKYVLSCIPIALLQVIAGEINSQLLLSKDWDPTHFVLTIIMQYQFNYAYNDSQRRLIDARDQLFYNEFFLYGLIYIIR